jgi:ribosomal protein S18 acetylase RimI-like enzyme
LRVSNHLNNDTGKMTIQIRDATPRDGATIAEFNSRMAVETEGRALDPAHVNPGVAAILTDPAKGRYWIAHDGGSIVGQIMVTYEWSDWRNGVFWWIGSVYIHADYRRQGVFSALYRHVETLARSDRQVCGLRLYVEKDNDRAQQTYLALGMRKPGYQVMEVDFRKAVADGVEND